MSGDGVRSVKKASRSARLPSRTIALRPNLLWSATRKTWRELVDDRLRDPDLAGIEIQQRAVGVDAADADDPEVDLELADEVETVIADDAAIPAAHVAAGDDDLEFVVLAENAGDLQIIGDDPQAFVAQQRLRHLLRRGADIDEERGVVWECAGPSAARSGASPRSNCTWRVL